MHFMSRVSERIYFFYKYVRLHKKFPNFNDPKCFSEKIFVRMIDPDAIYSVLADRVAVRDHLVALGLSNYLVPVYAVFEYPPSVHEIKKFKSNFVVKKSNSSGDVLIIDENNDVNTNEIACLCEKWWFEDYSDNYGERHYSTIPTRFVVEKKIGDKLSDYKMHIFQDIHGQHRYLFQVIHRHEEKFDPIHEILTEDWKVSELKRKGKLNASEKISEKPDCLELMKDIGKIILGDLGYLRIDLYLVDNQLFIGEITVTPARGAVIFEPSKSDRQLGGWIL